MWASLIEGFLASERDRGLEEHSLGDLALQLRFFQRHVGETGVMPVEITSEALRAWSVERVGTKSYATAKSVIWSLKRFFGWLTLTGECPGDPTTPLRYPRYRPRQSLPILLEDRPAACSLDWVLPGRFARGLCVAVTDRVHRSASWRRAGVDALRGALGRTAGVWPGQGRLDETNGLE